MKRFVTLTSNVFGVMMLAFAALVTVDTIARKLLNFSFQGTDELGGYALEARLRNTICPASTGSPSLESMRAATSRIWAATCSAAMIVARPEM